MAYMTNNKAKLTPLIPLMMVACLVWGVPAQAASFDCAKAGTKVEKLICADAGLSKLDEELNAAYKIALKDVKQVSGIKQTQKQWIGKRSECLDAECLKKIYQSRIQELSITQPQAGSVSNPLQVSPAQAMAGVPTFPKETDKKEGVKRVMAKEKFLSSNSYTPDKSFCGEFFKDFKQMSGVEFIEPVIQSEKYDDPVWNTYKTSCPDMELLDSFYCEPRIADYIDSLPEEEQKQMMNAGCSLYRGTAKFKLFKVDINDNSGDGIEHVFYREREHGPLNKPGKEQIDTNGGYRLVDLKRCHINTGVLTHDSYSYSWKHPLVNYNGIITYKGSHYIFDLFEIDVKARTPEKTTYELALSGYSKMKQRLVPLCSYNTLPKRK